MNLSPHFTLAEFTFSETASRKGLNNDMPTALYQEAKRTCDLLERIRAALTKEVEFTVPIRVTSGYRAPAVNAAVGGSQGSDHLIARAADIQAPLYGTAFELAKFLAPRAEALGIGQLIYEFGSWVHVSTKAHSPRNAILTISKRGTEQGINFV